MTKGGALLRGVKKKLEAATIPGVAFEELETLAWQLISQAGATPNFAQVPGYHWATCIMKNDELCHGIPRGKKVAEGDIITIDVGLLYEGWHLDTSISFGVGKISEEDRHFLEVGKQSLRKAINKARPGSSVYDISQAMQMVVERAGFGAVYQLTGHGIGEELHMEPSIPCVAIRADKRLRIVEGQTLAIEIMYARGNAALKLDDDGWTYRTVDGSLSGMFEETILVTRQGPVVLT